MSINRWIRWSIPVIGLMASAIAAGQAQAGSLLSQPGLAQAIAPSAAGWHFRYRSWGYGWGGYGGWGSYYYGRPSLYFGYRPYYAPRYYASYGFGSPYYTSYAYASPYYSTAFYGGYGLPAYRPVVYSTPLYTTSYYAAAPAVYGYGVGYGYGYGYPASYYAGHFGYSSYSFPQYGYVTYSPFAGCCGYW